MIGLLRTGWYDPEKTDYALTPSWPIILPQTILSLKKLFPAAAALGDPSIDFKFKSLSIGVSEDNGGAPSPYPMEFQRVHGVLCLFTIMANGIHKRFVRHHEKNRRVLGGVLVMMMIPERDNE